MSNILPVEKVIAIIKLVQPVTVNPKTKYLKIMVISETKDIAEKIEKATVYLDCWMTAEKIQELKSKRAFFAE